MELFSEIHDFFYAKMGSAFYYALIFLGIIAVVGQWRLYEKAGQPGYACLVPIWNVIVFLKIVGRPASHFWLLLIPVYGQLYLMPKIWIEVCQSFGKNSLLDYILVIALNFLYILNMGLSYETKYRGPVYGTQVAPPAARSLTNKHSLA